MVPAMTDREKIATAAAAEPMIEMPALAAARHEADRTTNAAEAPARRGSDPVGTTGAALGGATTRAATEATDGRTSSAIDVVAARTEKAAENAGTGSRATGPRARSEPIGTTAGLPVAADRAGVTSPVGTTAAAVTTGPSGPVGATTGAARPPASGRRCRGARRSPPLRRRTSR
jgi:hypothetical protein